MARRDSKARFQFHKDGLIRGAGFAAAIATVCGALAAGSVLRDSSPASSRPAARVVEDDAKDQTRVGAGGGRSASHGTSTEASSAMANVSIWHPGRIESAPVDPATAPAAPAPGADTSAEWRDQEFTHLEVVDGRTFTSGGVTVRIAGLELPPPDQVCRTLDSRLEQCATRAATQLELLTRSRTLACRYRMTTSSEAIGSCRIGAQDLAERMARTGYVRAAGPGRAVVADAGKAMSP